MKQPTACAALAAIVISSTGAESAAQTHEAPAPASQVQEASAAGRSPQTVTDGANPAEAAPAALCLEDAIVRTLRRQGIEVRIIDEKDRAEPGTARRSDSPAAEAVMPPGAARRALERAERASESLCR